MGINVLSLFDGISCGMIALERANIPVDNYYASEIEESAISISSRNYPNIIRLGDVTKINENVLANMPVIDLIIAGSPCQGFSRQGNGLNFEHPQSKLFFEFIRILEWIKKNNNSDVKFLLENVEMKREWRDTITSFLGVKPIDINSNLVSAQNRPRLYWTNIEEIKPPKDKGIELKDIIDRNVKFDFISYEGLKIDSSISQNSMKLIKNINGEIRITQSTKKGYIVASNGDGLNLSFPNSKSRRGRVIKKKSSTLDTQCNLALYYNNCIRRYTINELEKLQTLPVGYTEGVPDRKRIKAIGNGWTVDVITHILKHMKLLTT